MGLTPVLQFALAQIETSCMDSTLESTRVFWRRRAGYPEDVVMDPRPLAEIMAEQENDNDT